MGYAPDYWIIKNQWGSKWGDNGYMKITKSRVNDANCLIGASAFYLHEVNLMLLGWALITILCIGF